MEIVRKNIIPSITARKIGRRNGAGVGAGVGAGTWRTASLVWLGAGAIALLLAGCAGSRGRGYDPSGRPTAKAKPSQNTAFSSPTARRCLSDLQAAKIRFTPLSNRYFSSGCRAIDSVKLLDIGTPTANLGAMTCPLARNFAAWVQHVARPVARKYFRSPLVKIETYGTYNCRMIAGTRKLSQHALANAVDVAAFRLADGRIIQVKSGWRGTKSEQRFLRTLHKSACQHFGTVLGPDYDAAHRDHFHLDMSGDGFCR